MLNNIRIKSVHTGEDNPDFPNSDSWKVTLYFGKRQLTVPFYKGFGHQGRPPSVTEVLSCLISDAQSVANAVDFEDWCADFGYDTDSRKAERTYKECVKIAGKLHKFLGDEFNKFAEVLQDY